MGVIQTGTRSSMKTARGSAAIESLILTPCLILMVLLCVYGGRLTHAAINLREIADSASRSASLASLRTAKIEANRTAMREIQRLGVPCESASVASHLIQRGQLNGVRVEVVCRLNGRGLGLLKIPTVTLRTSSFSVVDRYRRQ